MIEIREKTAYSVWTKNNRGRRRERGRRGRELKLEDLVPYDATWVVSTAEFWSAVDPKFTDLVPSLKDLTENCGRSVCRSLSMVRH